MWRNDELPEPEIFTPERIAEFHLNNAMSEEDYRWAIKEVLGMGIDPLTLNPQYLILHDTPWRDLTLYLPTPLSRQSS